MEENKALIRRYFSLWESGKLDALDRMVDTHYVGHVATGDRDRDGLLDRIKSFRAVLPNVAFTIESQVAEGDLVATRLTAHGTHTESHTPIRLMGLNMSRIRGGKIVEEWNAWETVEELESLDLRLDELREE